MEKDHGGKKKNKHIKSLEQWVQQRRLKLFEQSLKMKQGIFLKKPSPRLLSGTRTEGAA